MFDLTGVVDSYDVLPAGEYSAVITNVEDKTSKSGGKYLNVEFTVQGPSQAGRKVWTMINYQNANPKAVQIALATLKQIAMAAKLSEEKMKKFDPLNSLVNLEMNIEVQNSEDEYGKKANIKKYKPKQALEAPKSASINDIPF